jgi:CheY-like chemotaxis protein
MSDVDAWMSALDTAVEEFRKGLTEEELDAIIDDMNVEYIEPEAFDLPVWLRSDSGRGASFFVELPVTIRAPEPSVRAAPAPATVSLELFKGARVLVVEDEPALSVAVSEALGDAGFVVDRAGDGEEGLTRLAEASYELIVCDLKMPRIDGMQFYRAMAAAVPALARRVIFVTGDVAGTDAERFLEETGCRWLSKPFRLGDLLRAARDTLS